jgi:aryl-alcohol dehydrogenase-like predicted oxidoreductase
MKYKLLGRSGLRVSEMCLGTRNLIFGGTYELIDRRS